MSETKCKILDLHALFALANQASSGLAIQASAAPEGREVTPEEIVELVKAAGGEVVVVYNEQTGEIDEIHASGDGVFEYDPAECDEILESLQASGLPKKVTGDLAQTSIGQDIVITGTLTSGSPIITSPSSTTGIALGNPISGTGVPTGTTITLLSPLTMSANPSTPGTAVPLTIEAQQQVIGLGEWSLSWKRKTAEATTTDDSAYESSLPSTASWSVKAKYMLLIGDTSQSTAIAAVIAAPQAPPQFWNFFIDVTVGHPAYGGFAYIDGIDISAAPGKIVGMDVSLKGTGPLTVYTTLAPVAQPNTVTGLEAED